MSQRHVVQNRDGVRQERLDAAPRVHHPAFELEVVAVKVHGNVDHRGNGDGVEMASVLAKRLPERVKSINSARSSAGWSFSPCHLHRWLKLQDLRLQPVRRARSAHRVHDSAVEEGVIVGVHQHQQPVRSDALEPDCSHEEPADDAPLDVQGILGEVDEVRGVHNVRVRDQRVADRRQKRRSRVGITSVPANLRANASGHEMNDAESLGIDDPASGQT